MPPKRKSSHSFYVFLLSHHTSQASIQRISRSHTFHSLCLSDEGGNSFGCIIRPRNSISYIYRRCLSHGTKGSCQVLIEDMMVVRIFKIRILTEKDQKYFKSPLFVKEYAGERIDKIKLAVNAQQHQVMKSNQKLLKSLCKAAPTPSSQKKKINK